MRAQQLDQPAPIGERPLHVIERAETAPPPGELRLDVAACGVCRTDLQLIEGDLAARHLPIVPGHQIVGRVAAVGAGVEEWSIGDRVGVAWLGGAWC